MSRKLTIDVKGKEYEFGLDRKELKRAEGLGFKINELQDKPVTQIELFWLVGLHKYQPKIKPDEASALMDSYIEEGGDVSEIIEFLSEEYLAFFPTTQVDTKEVKKARVEVI